MVTNNFIRHNTTLEGYLLADILIYTEGVYQMIMVWKPKPNYLISSG